MPMRVKFPIPGRNTNGNLASAMKVWILALMQPAASAVSIVMPHKPGNLRTCRPIDAILPIEKALKMI